MFTSRRVSERKTDNIRIRVRLKMRLGVWGSGRANVMIIRL